MALTPEEVGEPEPHLPRPAQDQHLERGGRIARRSQALLLAPHRLGDQHARQALPELGVEPGRLRRLTVPRQDLRLGAVVPDRETVRPLGGTDLFGQRQALGDPYHELPVHLRDPRSEGFEPRRDGSLRWGHSTSRGSPRSPTGGPNTSRRMMA